MHRAPSRSAQGNSPLQEEQNSSYVHGLPDLRKVGVGPLERWYRLTAPPEPPPSARMAQKEAARRGRLVSLFLLLLIGLVFLVLPIAVLNRNLPVILALTVGLFTDIAALRLNRRGLVFVTGLAIVAVSMASYILSQVFNPGGLRTGDLPDLDLLVQTELLAVTLLPARSVFVVAFLDSTFIWADVTFQPHSADLVHFLATDGYAAVGRPIFLQVVVAIVAYIWVRNMTRALARADQAEIIAALERSRATLEQTTASQARVLSVSIEEIRLTLRSVGNGDFHARVHLSQDDVLHPLAESFNQVLQRLQGLLAESDELSRSKIQTGRVISILHEARVTGHPPHLPEQGLGTTIDLLILELDTYLQTLYPTEGEQRDPTRPGEK